MFVWSLYLMYQNWGWLWAFVSFGIPGSSVPIVAVACFWWDAWPFALAVGVWLFSMLGMVFANDEGRHPKAAIAYLAALAALVSVSVHYGYAWATAPKPLSKELRDELAETAVGIVGVVNLALSDEPSATTALMELRGKLRRRLSRYDDAALAEVRSITQSIIRLHLNLGRDILDYLRSSSQDQEWASFALSSETKKAYDALPDAVKASMPELTTSTQALNLLRPRQNFSGVPPEAMGGVLLVFDEWWKKAQRTYEEFLGRSLPPLRDEVLASLAQDEPNSDDLRNLLDGLGQGTGKAPDIESIPMLPGPTRRDGNSAEPPSVSKGQTPRDGTGRRRSPKDGNLPGGTSRLPEERQVPIEVGGYVEVVSDTARIETAMETVAVVPRGSVLSVWRVEGDYIGVVGVYDGENIKGWVPSSAVRGIGEPRGD